MPPRSGLDAYREVWLVDFEFSAPPGERPTPVCLVAREFRSGRTLRLWQDDLRGRRIPPYPIGPDTLFVAYFASAELGCHLALGWPLPARVLDLYVEFRNRVNGLSPPNGFGLLGALTYHGLDAMDGAEKKTMRELASRGGPWTSDEREALLAYCESDVLALAKLLPKMEPELDLSRAVACRGRYMGAVARMEWAGVPIDTETLSRLRSGWTSIQDRLIREVDSRFGVFDGRTFKAERWAGWLARSGIPWPRLESGELALDDDTFREMARSYPDVALMRELRVSLSQLRLRELAVGSDGRNRRLLSPYPGQDGSEPTLQLPIHLRAVNVAPGPYQAGAGSGRGLRRLEPTRVRNRGLPLRRRGDDGRLPIRRPLPCVRQASRPDSSRRNQENSRGRAESYSRHAFSAFSTGWRPSRWPGGSASQRPMVGSCSGSIGRRIRAFWRWSDGAESHAMLLNRLHTVFGWTVRVGPDANPRSLRNFPCQANGAEMMRLACCLATERGVNVVAPVHDALMVEGPADAIDDVVARTQEAMAEASAIVLAGFRLRSDVKIVRWPDRYMDGRGREFWGRVMALLPAESEADSRPS